MQIAADLNIGHSSNDETKLNVGRVNSTEKWQGMIQRDIIPLCEKGCKTIFLHNPWGALDNEPMQFDQLLRAKDMGLNWLIDDYVDAWRQFASLYPEVTIVDYLGRLRDDIDFTQYYDGAPGEWMERVLDSIELTVKAGHSICFDAMGNSDPVQHKNSRKAIEIINERFAPAWIEASVPWADEELRGYPQWVTWQTYKRRHLAQYLHPAEVGKYPSWDKKRNQYRDMDMSQYGLLHVAIFRPEDFTAESITTVLRNGHVPVVRSLDQWDKVQGAITAIQEAEGIINEDTRESTIETLVKLAIQ